MTGAEFFPRLAVSSALEADRRRVHPIGPRGEHAQTQQDRLPNGRVGGGVREAALRPRLRILTPAPYGRQLEETADHARGRQLDIPQQVRVVPCAACRVPRRSVTASLSRCHVTPQTASMAEWLRAWDTLATMKLRRREVVSSIPDRGTIVG